MKIVCQPYYLVGVTNNRGLYTALTSVRDIAERW